MSKSERQSSEASGAGEVNAAGDATDASATASSPVPKLWHPPLNVLAGEQCVWTRDGLTLRFWEASDALALFDSIDADRASFLPWLPWVKTDNRSVKDCLTTIDRMFARRTRMEPAADDFTLGIFDARTGEALGGTGLHRIVHSAHEGEIGYWVRPDRRGEGICGRAVAALLSWAFTAQGDGGWGLRRVHVRCAASNVASQRVPRKLGLREEARLVQERWVDTIGWDDTLVWGVLEQEWDVARARLKQLP